MEEKNTKELFDEEIRNQIEEISSLYVGTEEKSQAIDDFAKMYRLRIEEMKAECDADEKYNRRLMEEKQHEAEDCQKANQLAEQVKDRYFKLGIEAAGIILPLIFYGHWMRKGLKFEETGTFTSTTFRGLISRFRPTKK